MSYIHVLTMCCEHDEIKMLCYSIFLVLIHAKQGNMKLQESIVKYKFFSLQLHALS